MISIRNPGSIGVNQAAIEASFEDDDGAVMYYDEAANQVGIEPVADKDADNRVHRQQDRLRWHHRPEGVPRTVRPHPGGARSSAKEHDVTVVGSVGVLLVAIDAGKIDEATADEWVSTWIDEIGYYVPYRTISEHR